MPPPTNIGLPARHGHVAVNGALGVQTDDASYSSSRIEQYDDEGLDSYDQTESRVEHQFGRAYGLGAPFSVGVRYGTSPYNDVGAEFGWGHGSPHPTPRDRMISVPWRGLCGRGWQQARKWGAIFAQGERAWAPGTQEALLASLARPLVIAEGYATRSTNPGERSEQHPAQNGSREVDRSLNRELRPGGALKAAVNGAWL
jgi:hypothetical protein